uniref:Glycosyltransferase n=1 Tax=candidate division CPR3 bacterium TaxID=2268181 RepID=A0A7V3J9A6_UNCC3
MHVMFVTNYCGWVKFGGAEVQAQQTAYYLEKLGVIVEWFGPKTTAEELKRVDLVHFFGAYDYYYHFLDILQEYKKPYVVSTIFFRKDKPFRTFTFRLFRILFFKILNSHLVEKRIQDLINGSSFYLPNSQNEVKSLRQLYNLNEEKIRIIPNGVESRFIWATPELFLSKTGLKEDFCLYVGRIERRKNTLLLIKICAKLNIPLVIIGQSVEPDFFQMCLKAAGPNVKFLPMVSHDDPLLASAYAAAKLFILPSWYETPGISALEAALAGANIAITKYGGTEEYFGDSAIYLNPYSTRSVESAIIRGLSQPKDGRARTKILPFTWEEVAKKTLGVYQETLNSLKI